VSSAAAPNEAIIVFLKFIISHPVKRAQILTPVQ
jgi:hypothetical protein